MFFSEMTFQEERNLSINHGPGWFKNQLCMIIPDSKYVYAYESPYTYVVSENIPIFKSKTWFIKTKPYQPAIAKGRYFSFQICLNPTDKKKNRKGREYVVTQYVNRLREQGIPKEQMPPRVMVYQAIKQWFESKKNLHGFEVIEMQTGQYNNISFYHKKNNDDIKYTTVSVTGTLIVTDAEQFLNSIFRGIGSQRRYGCGLLLITPL